MEENEWRRGDWSLGDPVSTLKEESRRRSDPGRDDDRAGEA